jgi:hypothetical protein
MTATISDRRQALAELARSRRAEGSAGRNLRVAAVTVATIGLVGLLGLWLSGSWSTPPELLAVRASVDGQIAEMMAAARAGAASAPDAGSNGSVFELIRQVPEGYRPQAREEIGRLFEAREAAEVESYFALPPDQRAAELDRRIKAEDQRRQAREAARNQRLAEAGGRPGGPQQAADRQDVGRDAGQAHRVSPGQGPAPDPTWACSPALKRGLAADRRSLPLPAKTFIDMSPCVDTLI